MFVCKPDQWDGREGELQPITGQDLLSIFNFFSLYFCPEIMECNISPTSWLPCSCFYLLDDQLEDDPLVDDYLEEDHLEEDHLDDDYLVDDHLEDDHIVDDHLEDDHLLDANLVNAPVETIFFSNSTPTYRPNSTSVGWSRNWLCFSKRRIHISMATNATYPQQHGTHI